jgi:hypothetical protein
MAFFLPIPGERSRGDLRSEKRLHWCVSNVWASSLSLGMDLENNLSFEYQ